MLRIMYGTKLDIAFTIYRLSKFLKLEVDAFTIHRLSKFLKLEVDQ